MQPAGQRACGLRVVAHIHQHVDALALEVLQAPSHFRMGNALHNGGIVNLQIQRAQGCNRAGRIAQLHRRAQGTHRQWQFDAVAQLAPTPMLCINRFSEEIIGNAPCRRANRVGMPQHTGRRVVIA